MIEIIETLLEMEGVSKVRKIDNTASLGNEFY